MLTRRLNLIGKIRLNGSVENGFKIHLLHIIAIKYNMKQFNAVSQSSIAIGAR